MPGELGIGVDIERISRFPEVRMENERLLSSFMTPLEMDYCFSKESPRPHIAARFAGKEAIIKALGGMAIRGISFRDIEITNDEYGVPSVTIKNGGKLNIRVEISMSHSRDFAVAFAVAIQVE
jgi:holo-[acyl-carrier protein] synthase